MMIRAARNYCVLPLLAVCLVFSGCMPEDIELPVRISSVSTGSPENVTASTATLNGNVTLYDSEKINCGFIYDISSNLTDTKGIKKSTTANGDYAFNISGLNAGTTYYYRAYAVDAGQYKYGDIRSFTTVDAIDLGLSVKWASCNVGATSPEDYGDYFAWGETTPKSSYTESNSVTYGLSASELASRGIIDADGDLTAAYDVATVNWGGDWRMPTSAEIGELIHKCSWSWTTRNGVKGCKVTGPNGSSIFLPAAGYRSTTAFYSAGSHGYCWSATPYSSSYDACSLGFGDGDYDWLDGSRYYGLAVRPVYGAPRLDIIVSTHYPEAITANSAILGGTVSGSSESVTCGIIYGTSSGLSSLNGTQKSTRSSGSFAINVTGLSPNTTYYYRAYVVVDDEYKYGDVRSFTTAQEITVSTGDASAITANSATLGGTVSGSSESVTCGIIYGTSSSLSFSNGTKKVTASSGSYSLSVTGLSANTTYYYRAYVVVDGEYKYGDVRSFTTAQEITVSTGDASAITANSATFGGTVSGSSKSVTCGIIYGTSSGLSSSNGTQKSTSSSGSFTIDVTGLSPNTTYYYRAYVVVEGEYKYGDIRSFTTTQNVSVTTGDAIDLGLSVKWASCNIGATSPEEYGDYYAWGETTTKSDYSSSTSVTGGLSISELASRGIIGADGNLTAAYDAATANWGGNWRMPTLDEIEELIDKCSWSWTTRNGVKGYKVTGPNGNSIFLPAAGVRYHESLYNAGSYGGYWSATPYSNSNYGAYYLYFYDGDYCCYYYYRNYGRAVRPVSEK